MQFSQPCSCLRNSRTGFMHADVLFVTARLFISLLTWLLTCALAGGNHHRSRVQNEMNFWTVARSQTYSPPQVDRIWLWVCYNKIPIYPIYPIFYLLKGDCRPVLPNAAGVLPEAIYLKLPHASQLEPSPTLQPMLPWHSLHWYIILL